VAQLGRCGARGWQNRGLAGLEVETMSARRRRSDSAAGRERSRKGAAARTPKTPATTEGAAGESAQASDGASFPIVGIGASAGGLEAFTQLLGALPLDTGLGFVLVQHLDPGHESALVQILARATGLPVREVENDETVEPNQVYVIPRDTNLTIVKGVLKLAPRPRTRAPHRPIDTFFESLAQDLRGRSVGVVLSGTASDGTLGLEAIKAEGGITFAQDDSAKYDSMPKSAVAAGCVDIVLSPADIAKELAQIAKHPHVAGQALFTNARDDETSATAHEDDETQSKGVENGYKKVLLLLRNHSGVDFSLYKSTTIQRRITRRLVLNKKNTLEEYADFLGGNSKELDTLYADVLIGVTSFFRNPETFDVVQHKVLSELLKQGGDEPLRCWVLGCSTGQEAYSIAIAFVEAAEKAPRMRALQIFATDLNDALLEKARHGLYAKSLVEDVTPERLRRFFVEEQGGYRVSKALREMVVFAHQNLVADPPFSRMDLISCRNLLIYLEPSLQKKAMPRFHYALKPGGFLLLGASESVGGFTELFEPVDKKHKIYFKKSARTPAFHLPLRKAQDETPPGPRPPLPMPEPGRLDLPGAMQGELSAQREADRITVNKFAPPAVLVNADLQVLQFRGPTGPFLEPPSGKATFDVLKMARKGLMLPLRSAINQAKKENKTIRKQNVRVDVNGHTRWVHFEVIPLKNTPERCLLIMFEQAKEVAKEGKRAGRPRGRATPKRDSSRVAHLETEVTEMREYTQALQEQHEAANEELQAANEEVQSANEELQSVNEELETSKEELESTNEELTTVNEEMFNRNVELTRVNNDLTNLQASTKLPIVLLGRDLAIRRFSPQAEKELGLLVTDVGRPIAHIRHSLVLGDATETPLDLEALGGEVISDVREQEREVREKKSDRWYSLRVRPYLIGDNRVDGAVLVLVDITERKRAEEAPARLAAIVTSSDDAIISKNLQGIIQTWNEGATRLFGYTAEEGIGKPVTILMPPDRVDEEPGILERVRRGETVDHYETVRQRKDRSLVDISLTVSPIRDTAGRIIGAANISRDITARKLMESELRKYAADLADTDERKNEFVAMLGHELRNPLSALANGLELQGRVHGDLARSEGLRGMMIRQTKRIATLLDQLLDLARVISGKIDLSKERVDLAEVIRAAVETVRPLIESQKHELTLTLPPEKGAFVLGDPVRLTQVVENLLTNAVKYTDEGGSLAVMLEWQQDNARVIVRDTGIGLNAAFLPHIFEVFTQAPRALDRAKGGLGLGLPLVRRLVDMHGGQVDASSPGPGQGSEFTVTLPLVKEWRSKERLKDAPAPSGKVRPRRILVVDDETDTAESLAELLGENGHEALAVADGPSALETVGTFHPEVVLLDLGLPGMDGYEVARRLRADDAGRKLLLIAVTGYQSDATKLKQAGFDQHLIKPPDMQKVSALLAKWDGGGMTHDT
jgi:two-component system, chemotaxis family, CheB/CheR fusion protein